MSSTPPQQASPKHRSRRLAGRLHNERGMTLVEVLVASLVLVVGLLAVADGLNAAQRGSSGGERSAVLAQAGDQALQAIEAFPYANIEDKATPVKTTTTDKTNPTYYLSLSSTCSGSIPSPSGMCFQWDPSDPASTEPVDVDTTNGLVAPGPTTEVVPSPTGGPRITISVYAFVTDVTDSVCNPQAEVFCPTSPSYKRVTVVVKNASGGAPYDPLYFSTFVSNKVGQTADPLTQPGTTCTDGATPGVPCLH